MAFFAYGICLHIDKTKKKKTPSTIPCVWHPKPKNKCQIPRRNLWETETRSPVTCGTCRIIQVCLSLRLIELPLPIWDTFVECLPLGPPPRIWNLAFMRVIYVNLLFLYLFSFRHFFWRVFLGVLFGACLLSKYCAGGGETRAEKRAKSINNENADV